MRCIMLMLVSGIVFYSCQITVKKDDSSTNKGIGSSSKIRNGIILNESGLKVSEAYLTYEDGSLVSNENAIDIDKKVILHLNVSGWAVTNNVSFPGASEKISTSDGDVLLDEDDLLDAYSTNGVSAEDAESITLSAVITQASKIYEYFLVEFRVWDKKSNSSVSGSYKLFLK